MKILENFIKENFDIIGEIEIKSYHHLPSIEIFYRIYFTHIKHNTSKGYLDRIIKDNLILLNGEIYSGLIVNNKFYKHKLNDKFLLYKRKYKLKNLEQ
jgi:hypothetical protein